MSPKLGQKSNVRIERNIQNESCSITWVDPKTFVEPSSNPQTSPSGLQKDKNDPKIKSNLNVRIQGIIQNESLSTTWVDPKTVLEPHIEPKNSPLGPRKSKMTPNSCQNQMSKLKEAKKTKVVALYK